MFELSQRDREIIAEYPLGGDLEFLRERLRAIDEPQTDSNSHGHQKSVSLLLAALMGHEAAYNLECRGSNADLASELSKAFTRVRTGLITHEHFRPLAILVTRQAPDTEIWEAVLGLIETLSHVTPPPSAPASLDETPVTRSSSSFQGSEQTKKVLDPALFYEIQRCTYRNVEGFFEKYFEDKSWERRSNVIFRSVKRKRRKGRDWHDSNRWVGISDQPEEEEMWSWLSRFQTEYMAKSPGAFYAARNSKELTGAEAKRQLDVLMKRRIDQTWTWAR